MLVQSALLGAGSLDQRLVKALRARPSVARRYLALEGRRVLAELATRIPLAAALPRRGTELPRTADESLEMAKGRAEVADRPEWFGVIKPSRLLASSAGPGAQATANDLRLEFDIIDLPEADDDADDDGSRPRKARSSSSSTIRSSSHRPCRTIFRKLLGNSRSPGRALPAPRCRSAPCGGRTRPGRMPGRFPPGSNSPMTASPAPP